MEKNDKIFADAILNSELASFADRFKKPAYAETTPIVTVYFESPDTKIEQKEVKRVTGNILAEFYNKLAEETGLANTGFAHNFVVIPQADNPYFKKHNGDVDFKTTAFIRNNPTSFGVALDSSTSHNLNAMLPGYKFSIGHEAGQTAFADRQDILTLEEYFSDAVAAHIFGKQVAIQGKIDSTPIDNILNHDPNDYHPTHQQRIEALEKGTYAGMVSRVFGHLKEKAAKGEVTSWKDSLKNINLENFRDR